MKQEEISKQDIFKFKKKVMIYIQDENSLFDFY
jgi:hypothetical protein